MKNKLGWLQIRLLLILKNEKTYGYQIMKTFESLGERISPGTLYPTLAGLNQEGLISASLETGSGGKRKVYCITEKGEEKLREIYIQLLEPLARSFHKPLMECEAELIKSLGIKKGQDILYLCLEMKDALEYYSKAVGKWGKVVVVPRFLSIDESVLLDNVKIATSLRKIPDSSMDLIIYLHDSLLPGFGQVKDVLDEFKRILRKGGSMEIITLDTDNILYEVVAGYLLGRRLDESPFIVEDEGFKKISETSHKGVIFSLYVSD